MSLTILLEIGHDASLRSKTTAEGFTHDWEVFVKGQNGADIHYYVDKVVFYLHETFPNPKRVVKEPPFSLRTSGYAGFKLPIEIHLKNNQEPKRIKFNYELYLQPTGPPIHRTQKEKYTFFNPSEEFRSKLLKGGAIEGGGSNHEINVNRVEKNQMTSKPKLSGSDFPKKHKMKVEEPRTTDFENLFGPPIKKTSKLPEIPKLKEPPKPPNTDKPIDKEKNDKTKSNKSTHKDKEKPKEKSSDTLEKKNKDERKKFKDDKSKDKDRSKEKSYKKEREKSPLSRPRSPTPKRSPRRDPSPLPVQKHSSGKEKETNKEEKKDKERDKDNKREEKKSKKDKKDHKEGKHKDRDRDKDHRDHKNKESKSREKEPSVKQKEASPVPPATVLSQNAHKTDKKPKEKEQTKEDDKIERADKVEKIRNESEERQKHKHKKKDRKEKKEEKHSKKEEKKIDKQPNSISNNSKESPVKEEKTVNRQVDKSNLFGSPKSDSPSTPKEPEIKVENNAQSIFREDESSNDSVKLSSKEASPAPPPPPAPPRAPSKSPSPLPPPEAIKKPEPEKKKEPSPKKKEKKEKKKDKKIDREKDEKRKKRKSDSTTTIEAEPPEKVNKVDEIINSDEESKVSSTEDTTPVVVPPKSECDMDMLRELQRKIMSLKDNADLQRVVQLIAETGQYEVSAHTFDFDLCLLDRSTVRQLQDFFSTIS